MKVTVFGASGKVGSQVVANLLNNDYQVVAFVHSSKNLPKRENLTIVTGDVHNLDDVTLAIKGSDIVISALGSWGTKQKDIVSSGTDNIIKAMSGEAANRLITLTGSDALAEGDKTTWLSRIFHSLIMLSPAKRILIDGELHIHMVQKSSLDWTVIRSPIMNNRGKELKYTLGIKKPMPWTTINRRSVAEAMVKVIDDSETYQKLLFITRS